MEFDNIQFSDFKTFLFRSSYLSGRYVPNNDSTVFVKNRSEVSLFDHSQMEHYVHDSQYSKVKVFDLTEDEYREFKKLGYKHTVVKNQVTILSFDDAFFLLQGKKHSKIRYYKNYFDKIIRTQDAPNSRDELFLFLQKWTEIRRPVYFRMFTGYAINFINRYYEQYKDRIVSRFFYIGDELVGYYMTERVSDTLYNQLYRYANTTYSHLSLYLDYCNFRQIYDEVQKPFLVNMEGDVGLTGIKQYKNENFTVFKCIPSIDVKIDKPEQEKKGLFTL